MRRPVNPATSPPARASIPGRWPSAWIGASVVLGAVVVLVGTELLLGRSILLGDHPVLSIGAIVTMVGPLGVTFPCWAAGHFARPTVVGAGGELAPRP